eukprot:6027021-Pleurochrysis_carterae.AAC.5
MFTRRRVRSSWESLERLEIGPVGRRDAVSSSPPLRRVLQTCLSHLYGNVHFSITVSRRPDRVHLMKGCEFSFLNNIGLMTWRVTPSALRTAINHSA